MFTLAFVKAAGERAVRAFASTLISTWVIAGQVFDLRGIDWGSSLGVAGGAALISVLLSIIAGAGVGPAGSPSFVSDPAAAGETSGGGGGSPGMHRVGDGTGTSTTGGSNVRTVGGHHGDPGPVGPPPT